MVEISSHRVSMADKAELSNRITPEMVKRRLAHLDKLHPLEAMVRRLSPLPISYDVTRLQPPYFFEFTYTEMLGGMLVSPQSIEAHARVVQRAAGARADADVVALLAHTDKYKPKSLATPVASVAFIPGSNIFADAVSRERLTHVMQSDPDAFIKPHPMTNEELLRDLGREFGYHRILDPDASGHALIDAAERIYSCQTSELGLYALLKGKRIVDITRLTYAPRCTYHGFYRLADADALRAAINGPCSGFLHPDDPGVERKAQQFFETAMQVREELKPLVNEFGPSEWAQAINARQQKGAPGAVRPN